MLEKYLIYERDSEGELYCAEILSGKKLSIKELERREFMSIEMGIDSGGIFTILEFEED